MMNKQTSYHQKSMFQINRSTSQDGSISKSPTKNVSGIKVYNFSNIDSYGKIQKPFLNEEKKKNLQWRL